MPKILSRCGRKTEGQAILVSLRVAYLMPENLRQYVGPVGVWGDVNDILTEGLLTMKACPFPILVATLLYLEELVRCTCAQTGAVL